MLSEGMLQKAARFAIQIESVSGCLKKSCVELLNRLRLQAILRGALFRYGQRNLHHVVEGSLALFRRGDCAADKQI